MSSLEALIILDIMTLATFVGWVVLLGYMDSKDSRRRA